MTLILVNIPLLVSWLLIYSAHSVLALNVAITMMGVCIGFMQAPVLTYIGESIQPHLRGILLSTVQGVFFGSGLLLETVLGAVVDWRTMAAITALGPAAAFVVLLFVSCTAIYYLTYVYYVQRFVLTYRHFMLVSLTYDSNKVGLLLCYQKLHLDDVPCSFRPCSLESGFVYVQS